MIDYSVSLADDILQQFADMPNTSVLIRALAKQLQDVLNFFDQLKSDRCVEAAQGKQLDGIGDIVDLTRNDATKLLANMSETYELTDETYRMLLKYKIFVNTNITTYDDVMKAFAMFWHESPLFYSEDPEQPATIIISTPVLRPEQNAAKLFEVPYIKAAGVTLKLYATTETPMPSETVRTGCAMFPGISVTILPQQVFDFAFNAPVQMIQRSENVAQSLLPEIVE